MDAKEKTRHILGILSRRSTVRPAEKRVDPRFTGIEHVPEEILFSQFNPNHIKVASKIVQILLAENDFEKFCDLADQVRTFENDGLFLYALYSSVLHRDDCHGVMLPPIEEIAPHWFFAAETIHEAIQLTIHRPNENHIVVNQKTAENTEPENRLAYFREDISLNTHHWSWHVIFPTQWDVNETRKMKDRQGEIFYYMHQQMMARYNAERFSNGLNRVTPLQNFREPLLGYFPHMTSQITGVHIGSRPEGLTMKDLPSQSVQDLEVWRIRILEAIDQKFVRDSSGQFISLENERGIDILGAMVESTLSSPNREFYGNIHNVGHNIISRVHDPDGRFREQPGVMAFVESAPRDPIFYRWHGFIDSLFNRHKTTLRPYTPEELSFGGIQVNSVEVRGKEKNVIETFMEEDFSHLNHAPFLKTDKTILVTYEHLDHEPLTFVFQIQNNTGIVKDVTIRVFLGPKVDEEGNAFELDEQRRLMIELDKIRKTLYPGSNEIKRNAIESSVTLVSDKRKSFSLLREGNFEGIDYCTCGWPEHMLVPKGTQSGMDFVLFTMCTDYDLDKPDWASVATSCDGAISYCGAKDQKYPDKKPMGFPFDRPITDRTMTDFKKDNMAFIDVKIKFTSHSK